MLEREGECCARAAPLKGATPVLGTSLIAATDDGSWFPPPPGCRAHFFRVQLSGAWANVCIGLSCADFPRAAIVDTHPT